MYTTALTNPIFNGMGHNDNFGMNIKIDDKNTSKNTGVVIDGKVNVGVSGATEDFFISELLPTKNVQLLPSKQDELTKKLETVSLTDALSAAMLYGSDSKLVTPTNAMILALKELSVLMTELTDEISKLMLKIRQIESSLDGIIANLLQAISNDNAIAKVAMMQSYRTQINNSADDMIKAAMSTLLIGMALMMTGVFLCATGFGTFTGAALIAAAIYMIADAIVRIRAAQQMKDEANGSCDSIIQTPNGANGLMGIMCNGDQTLMNYMNIVMQGVMMFIAVALLIISGGAATFISVAMITNSAIALAGSIGDLVEKIKQDNEHDPEKKRDHEELIAIFGNLKNGLAGGVLAVLNETVYKDDLDKLSSSTDSIREEAQNNIAKRDIIASYVNAGVMLICTLVSVITTITSVQQTVMSELKIFMQKILLSMQTFLSISTAPGDVISACGKSGSVEAQYMLQLIEMFLEYTTELLAKSTEEIKHKAELKDDLIKKLSILIQNIEELIEQVYTLATKSLD